MRKILLLGIALALVGVFTGCGTTAKFVYPARMDGLVRINTTPVFEKTVAVLPFDDYRNSQNSSTPLLLFYVPLMPFGWIEYDRPDAARMFITVQQFEFTPSEDLPKAAAVSLRRSNLFSDAYFSFGGKNDCAGLVLSGEIKSTKYQGNMWGYGLSLFGTYPWLLGAPCGNSENTLILELTLKNKKRIIWQYTFNRSHKVWQWLYYQLGHDVLGYSELMQEAMNEAIVDLASKLRENPKLLD